ncbi:Sec-independent protein translocase TatB [Arthrobacter psychrolactophilus]
MFGINTPELILIVVLAVLLIGPTRLPGYLEKLKNLIREVRKMASGARETIKQEAGVDIDDIDWKKYDPRQYDPRRIIREALLDDDDVENLKSLKMAPGAAIASMMGKDELKSADDVASQPGDALPAAPEIERLAEGQRAPFDVEAT